MEVLMDFEYVSAKEAALKLNLTERWIQQLCKDGRVEGAKRFGTQGLWLVPVKWVSERASMSSELNEDKN